MLALRNSPVRYSLYISRHFIFDNQVPSFQSEWSAFMTDETARENAIALSQNLISFHKGRPASAPTPIKVFQKRLYAKSIMIRMNLGVIEYAIIPNICSNLCFNWENSFTINWPKGKASFDPKDMIGPNCVKVSKGTAKATIFLNELKYSFS
jgi:hypothetical protein